MAIVVLKRREWVLLSICWILTQMFFLHYTGIVTTGEAEKYTGIANQLASGNWHIQSNYYMYAGYFLMLLILKLAGLSYNWMYLVQLVIAFISFSCFIRLLSTEFSNRVSVILSAILFAICPMYQAWNCFLFTDPMFTHLLIISIYLLVLPFSQKKPAALIFFLLVLPFFRPFGLLFIPAAIFYWLVNDARTYKNYIISFSLYFILLLLFSGYNLSHAYGFYYPNHDSEANIICAYPSPLTKYIIHPYNAAEGVFRFYISNPSMTWRLFLFRLYKSFWMTRPYFSNVHNIILILFMTIYYGLAITGMVAIFLKRQFKKTSYLFVGLLIFSIPKMIYCADWDNRIILPLLIFIFFFMAFGINFLINRFSGNKKPDSKVYLQEH